MSNDDLSLIARSASASEKIRGEPMTSEEIAKNFALYGLHKRAEALERFDGDLCSEIDSSPHRLRRHVQLMELRRKMGGVHEALRKARR